MAATLDGVHRTTKAGDMPRADRAIFNDELDALRLSRNRGSMPQRSESLERNQARASNMR
jgi:hypothetical protein